MALRRWPRSRLQASFCPLLSHLFLLLFLPHPRPTLAIRRVHTHARTHAGETENPNGSGYSRATSLNSLRCIFVHVHSLSDTLGYARNKNEADVQRRISASSVVFQQFLVSQRNRYSNILYMLLIKLIYSIYLQFSLCFFKVF